MATQDFNTTTTFTAFTGLPMSQRFIADPELLARRLSWIVLI